MVKTHGLTHIALAVKDVDCSLVFYREVFGVVETYRSEGFLQVETPGCHDVIVFEETAGPVGETGSLKHFGFRLVDPADIDLAVREVERAGGTILSRGEFCPGEPYAFVADPDGYEVEIWFEPARTP